MAVGAEQHAQYAWCLPYTNQERNECTTTKEKLRAYCPDIYTVDLGKTEEEIITLRNVLASKEAHAQELKHRLGITAWREFSEDMTQGLKTLKDSQAYKKTGEAFTTANKKTGEAFTTAKSKTASVWSSISNSQSLNSAGWKMASAFGDAKTKVTSSFSRQNSTDANGLNGDGKVASDATEGTNKVSMLTGTM